jgi:hypothetical protein
MKSGRSSRKLARVHHLDQSRRQFLGIRIIPNAHDPNPSSFQCGFLVRINAIVRHNYWDQLLLPCITRREVVSEQIHLSVCAARKGKRRIAGLNLDKRNRVGKFHEKIGFRAECVGLNNRSVKLSRQTFQDLLASCCARERGIPSFDTHHKVALKTGGHNASLSGSQNSAYAGSKGISMFHSEQHKLSQQIVPLWRRLPTLSSFPDEGRKTL